MSATKRKFNALLQGLSETRPANENTASNAAILQKRRRLGFPPSTAPKFDTPSFSSAPTSSALRSKRPLKSPQKPALKFCPTDRDELLKRLETFQDITKWTPKPDQISEIDWAKRGWICQSKETVRCILCSKELVVKLSRSSPDDADADEETASATRQALVDKYAGLVNSAHFEDCLWRKRGCADNMLRLSLTNGTSVRTTLRQRYDELLLRKDMLPYDFNLRLPEELDIDSIVKLLPSDFFAESTSKSTPIAPSTTPGARPAFNKVALSLALAGWQGLPDVSMGTVLSSISCRTCLRRLGLWMFKSKEVDANGAIATPAPMEYLDIIREHRFFCPWKNPSTQSSDAARSNGDEGLPGWRVLEQTLRNESNLRSVYEGGDRTSTSTAAVSMPGDEVLEMSAEDEEAVKAKDKERWARLKKIKSLFDIRGGRKDKSRPSTAHSTRSGHQSGL